MASKVVKLNESELKNIIRESVVRFLNENADELSPGFAMHAAHAAADDKKKHTGRGKNSPDPAIRAKRDAQIKKFGDYAANGINQDIDDPDLLAIGDRAARRMMYANGPYSAYLTNDIDDIDSVKLYNDDYAEGDEPMTIGDLPDDERKKIHRGFDKFKAHHAHAKELDDKYLEEAVKRAVRNVLNENKLWDAILNDMKEFANSGKDVYDFIEFATKKYGIDEERFYTSGGYEDWCRLTGEDPSTYEI